MEKKNKTPQKQLDWQKEYDLQKMATIAMKMSKNERHEIESVAKEKNMKLSSFCRACIKYCIEHNIDLSANQSFDKSP